MKRDENFVKSVVFTKIIENVAESSGKKIDSVTAEQSLDNDLGLDSLDRLLLIIEIEQILNICTLMEEVDQLETVQDVLDLCNKKRTEKN